MPSRSRTTQRREGERRAEMGSGNLDGEMRNDMATIGRKMKQELVRALEPPRPSTALRIRPRNVMQCEKFGASLLLQITFVNREFTRVTSAREANRLRPRQSHQHRSYFWVCTAGLVWPGRANETRVGTDGGRQRGGSSRPIVNTHMTNRRWRDGQCKGYHSPSSFPSPQMESFSGLTMRDENLWGQS